MRGPIGTSIVGALLAASLACAPPCDASAPVPPAPAPAATAAAVPATAAAPADSAPPESPRALRSEWTFDGETLASAGVRRPSRLAYDSDGNLHVLDSQTRRVVKLDPRGRVLYEVGGYGSDETSLELPVDIAVDRDQTLLVLDRGRGALVAFDRAGRFLASRPFHAEAEEVSRDAGVRLLLDRFGKVWLLSPRGRDLLPLDDRLRPARSARYLTPEDSVVAPGAAVTGERGEAFVYDASRGGIRRFDATGRLVSTIRLDGERLEVADLAVDKGGSVYAADPVGQRVLVFDSGGRHVLTRFLGGPTIPWRPAALALGPRGRIAVADPERGVIQVLAPEREARP